MEDASRKQSCEVTAKARILREHIIILKDAYDMTYAMRIIPFFVFYVTIYVARFTTGGTATTNAGNSLRFILAEKTRTTRDEISKALIDDIAQRSGTIMRNNRKQSLLVNRINDVLQNRRIVGELTRVKRGSLRRKAKLAEYTDGKEIMYPRTHDSANNDDECENENENNAANSRSRRFLMRHFPESVVSTINLDLATDPTIIQTDTIDRSSFALETKSPSDDSENADSEETILPTYANAREIFNNGFPATLTLTSASFTNNDDDRHRSEIAPLLKNPVYVLSYPDNEYANVSREGYVLSKISVPKFETRYGNDGHAIGPTFERVNAKIFVPVYYYPGTLDAVVRTLNYGRSQKNHSLPPNSGNNTKKLHTDDDRLADSNRIFLLVPISTDLRAPENLDGGNSRINANRDSAMSTIRAISSNAFASKDDRAYSPSNSKRDLKRPNAKRETYSPDDGKQLRETLSVVDPQFRRSAATIFETASTTQSPVTLDTSIATALTTSSSLFYTTRLATSAIDELATMSTELETITMLTEKISDIDAIDGSAATSTLTSTEKRTVSRDVTDVTTKITIPATQSGASERTTTSATTEKEFVKSTLTTETTQTPLHKCIRTNVFGFPIGSTPATTEEEWTNRTSTLSTILSSTITERSSRTGIAGVTGSETRTEKVTSSTMQTSTLATGVAREATAIGRDAETTSAEEAIARMTPEKSSTIGTNATTTSTTNTTEDTSYTSADTLGETLTGTKTITAITEGTSTSVTGAVTIAPVTRLVSTTEVVESTIEILTPDISEITIARHTVAITASSTVTEDTSATSYTSTETEVGATATSEYSMSAEEVPMTQIEKISTAEETTTTTTTTTTTELSTTGETRTIIASSSTEVPSTVETFSTTETLEATMTSEILTALTATETTGKISLTVAPATANISTTTETPTIHATRATTKEFSVEGDTTMSPSVTFPTSEEFPRTIATTNTTSLITATVTLNETTSSSITISSTASSEVVESTTSSPAFVTTSTKDVPSKPPITKIEPSVDTATAVTNETTSTAIFAATEGLLTSPLTPATTTLVETISTVLSTSTAATTTTTTEQLVATTTTTNVTLKLTTTPSSLTSVTSVTLSEAPHTAFLTEEIEISPTMPITATPSLETFLATTQIPLTTSEMISTTIFDAFSLEITESAIPAEITTPSVLRGETNLTTTIPILLSITDASERTKILEIDVTVTIAPPLTESPLSTLITPKTFAAAPVVTFALPQTAVSEPEEFATTIERPLSRVMESSTTLSAETTSISEAAIAEGVSEAATEYYSETEPRRGEEEEYGEGEEEADYDTEIPTDKWYDYEEYEETSTAISTGLLGGNVTRHPSYGENATSATAAAAAAAAPSVSYGTETEISELATSRLISEIVSSTLVDGLTSIATETSRGSTEEFSSVSAVESSALTVVVANLTTPEEKTGSATESATTVGSADEKYIVLSASTISEVTTKPLPLKFPTVFPKYKTKSASESSTQTWRDITLPKFITKPRETSDREIESRRTTASFEETGATISEDASTEAEREVESTIHDLEITRDRATPGKTEEDVGREELREQLLRRLDELERREKELAEREERLREKERRWHGEMEKCKMMRSEKGRTRNETTAVKVGDSTTLTDGDIISPDDLTVSITAAREVASSRPAAAFVVTASSSLPDYEMTTVSTAVTTQFHATEVDFTPAKYITEKIRETTYAAPYVTEREGAPMINSTGETEETYAADLHDTGLVYVESTAPFYTIGEIRTASSDSLFASPAIMAFTSPVTAVVDEFTVSPAIPDYVSPYDVVDVTPATIDVVAGERYAADYAIPRDETTPGVNYTSALTSSVTKPATDLDVSPIVTVDDGASFVEISASYTTDEYARTYGLTDIFDESPLASPRWTISDTTTVAVTGTEYDREIKSLREELRERERELERREGILLEREERLERYIAEFGESERGQTDASTASSRSITLTNSSTPVPPTESTAVTDKKNRTTARTVEEEPLKEKEEFKYVTEKIVTRKKEKEEKEEEEEEEEEHEIATKRICLNVLENTTIPADMRKRDVVIKRICLPYFPERNKKDKSAGQLNRKLLVFRGAGETRGPKINSPSNKISYGKGKVMEIVRRINNLQLSHREWSNNETTKPLRYFKGFTRIYRGRKARRSAANAINARRNSGDSRTFASNRRRGGFDRYEDFLQLTTMSASNGDEECVERNTVFGYNSNSKNGGNDSFDDEAKEDERWDISSTSRESNRSWSTERTAIVQKITTVGFSIVKGEKLDESENEFYTVNVLRLNYDKDRETHEVISSRPDDDELTMFTPESYNEEEYDDRDDNLYYGFMESGVTKPYYEFEDKNSEDDFIENTTDRINDYIYHKDHETSALPHREKTLDDRDERETVKGPPTESLDQKWLTEKNATYHLGGTRFWEVDFEVTEPSHPFNGVATASDTGNTIDLSNIRTTCLHVIFKNRGNNTRRRKRSAHFDKQGGRFTATRTKYNVYGNKTNKYSTAVEKQENVFRKNVIGERASSDKPKTKKEFKGTLRQLRSLDRYKSVPGKKVMRLDQSSYVGNDADSKMTRRKRSLCGIAETESKYRIAKHNDGNNAKRDSKKKRSNKKSKNRNVDSYSSKACIDSCTMNKKSSHRRRKKTMAKTIAKLHTEAKNSNEKVSETTYKRAITVDRHKNKSIIYEKGAQRDCLYCICDILDVINRIKSILGNKSYPLDEIKALNCSKHKEIRDEIMISMNLDVKEAKIFLQPRYNIESLKGQKYVKLEELEDDFKNNLEPENDHNIVSLPGLNLNVPCNQNGDEITWLSSISKPSYIWKRKDGIALYDFIAENGDLRLRNVNAKNTGNYTCIMTYMNPDNEEFVETTYEVQLQVSTLPKYILHGANRYHARSCSERDLDILVTYFPLKLNNIVCEENICNTYALTPSCSRNQIIIDVLIMPLHIFKLITVDPKHCNVICLKAIQDKFSLILSKNLQIFFGKTIIFRLPHFERTLVPIVENPLYARRKRGKTGGNAFGEKSNIGLFSSCPAGYGLRDSHCVPCTMDTYSEDGISHCKKCPPGTYQPNYGSRVCRTCTNPLTKGCYNMLWNSFSTITIALASLGVALSILLLLLSIIYCIKKKFCMKRLSNIISDEAVFKQEKRVEKQPLIKDVSENEDQQTDSEYRVKRKKGKFYVNKKRRKQNEKRKYNKTRAHEDEWGSHCMKDSPIICLKSYRSHEDYNNHYPKQSYRKVPRLPEYDFDT